MPLALLGTIGTYLEWWFPRSAGADPAATAVVPTAISVSTVATAAPTQPPTEAPAPTVAPVNEYLAKQGITRWVECAIALAEPVAEKDVADSQVPVWLPFNIAQQARSLTTRTPLSMAELEQINVLLARRADEQRAVEADRQKHNRA